MQDFLAAKEEAARRQADVEQQKAQFEELRLHAQELKVSLPSSSPRQLALRHRKWQAAAPEPAGAMSALGPLRISAEEGVGDQGA